MSFEIRPVVSHADFTTFIKLPRLIYRGMAGYEPPLDFERRELLDPKKSKFFEHAEAQYFLAYQNDRAVGRVSAQIDRLALETWGQPIGMFGCLDAIDDASLVKALCDTAADWLSARGMTRMRGPFTLSPNGESGVMVEGQDRRATLLMPWHPRYLAAHIAAAGLSGAKDLLAISLPLRSYDRHNELMAKVYERLPSTLVMRPFDLKQLKREITTVRVLFNEAWKDNWSFVPFTQAEVEALAESFKHFLIPECGVIAELDGKPVGFALVLPNLNELTRDFDGRLLPFNWIRFVVKAFRVSSYTSARLPLFGILPNLRRIGSPLALAIIDRVLTLRELVPQLQECELGWILEDNRPLLGLMAGIGIAKASKRYRVFERELG